MPVVNISKGRLEKLLPQQSIKSVIETLPFIGLDIEGIDGDDIRVEYNPNRPDFSSDYGIIRALKGLLEIETGLPKVQTKGKSGMSIFVEPKASRLRPIISALVAIGGSIDDLSMKQLISMQEDLHNGLGRRRRKGSIGFHSLDAISPPIRYTTRDEAFSFMPLGENDKMSIRQILTHTPTGKEFSYLTADWVNDFPLIIDSAGNVLSFPPIINGSKTRLKTGKSDLFVEVTAMDKKTSDEILAIIASYLSDAGYKIQTVEIHYGSKKVITPALPVKTISARRELLCSTLGLDIPRRNVIKSLSKCRLGAKSKGESIICTVPSYRSDIHSTIDLAEELMIGYGIQNIAPSLPSTFSAGNKSTLSKYLDCARQVMVGSGMVENQSFSLTNSFVLFEPFGKTADTNSISVEASKSGEHNTLRDSLLPSLLEALSHNIHEEYPQRMFEVGKVFRRTGDNRIDERWYICGIIAHAEADFAEVKSRCFALLELGFGISDVSTVSEREASCYFIPGRSAKLTRHGALIGELGEIRPQALEHFKMRMPACAFELDLSGALEIQK